MPESSPDKKIQKARAAVYRLLKIRLRSEGEIRDKLLAKKFPKQIVEETLAYFRELNLIDDQEFTRQWISSRLARPFGTHRIRSELKLKGIKDDTIKEQLDLATDQYQEEDIVSELAQHRAQKYHGVEPQKVKQRVYGYLLRRGFSTGSIVKAVKKL